MMKNRWIDITDPVGRELLGRAGDLNARFIIIDHVEAIYTGPGNRRANDAVATLMHACDYLKDRIGYEMEPHPRGMIRLPDQEKAENALIAGRAHL
jgi:hypothetical protein